MVAERKRRKPREIKRPWDNTDGKSLTRADDGSVKATGMAAVMAATRGGARRG